MKILKVKIELSIPGDEDDEETLKTDIYEKLQELMDSEELEFSLLENDDE